MHALIIFASGRGSNAQAIIDHFETNGKASVALIVTNRADAGVLSIAKAKNIPFTILDRDRFQSEALVVELRSFDPSLIILAGFLWKIPGTMIDAFPNRIINIHPALLPGYGGRGMYGHHVHNAVLAAGERESGISIHYVNERYDEGDIILQAKCTIEEKDTAIILADRIHRLEHFFYPRTIEYLLDTIC